MEPLPQPPEIAATEVGSLAAEARAALRLLAGRAWMDDFYLAGSAALALYVGHRTVRGLDFMAPANRLRSPHRRDLLAHLLDADPQLRVETARDGFLHTRTGEGTPLRFFYYPYPLVAPLVPVSLTPVSPVAASEEETEAGAEGESSADGACLEVASPLDLALMKVAAIISRGTRRDFADLVLLSREVPLATVLTWSPEKFGHVRDFPLQALKGLADLEQAPDTPLPELTPPLTWADVERWVEDEVRPLARRHVGLTEGEWFGRR